MTWEDPNVREDLSAIAQSLGFESAQDYLRWIEGMGYELSGSVLDCMG